MGRFGRKGEEWGVVYIFFGQAAFCIAFSGYGLENGRKDKQDNTIA
jgi:hypothetical protein